MGGAVARLLTRAVGAVGHATGGLTFSVCYLAAHRSLRMGRVILVILGAGATYDSDSLRPAPRRGMVSGFDPLRPPLTQDLFDTKYGAILQRHPACLRLVPDLRDAVAAGRPIEPELERLRARAQTTHPTLAAALIALRGDLAERVAKSEADWADVTRAPRISSPCSLAWRNGATP